MLIFNILDLFHNFVIQVLIFIFVSLLTPLTQCIYFHYASHTSCVMVEIK